MLVLGFSLLGLLFSGWSALVHYRLRTRPNYVGPCNITTIFNCSDAYLSRFGSIGGVSIAIPGIIFFELAALLAALNVGRPNDASNTIGSYIFALSMVGLVVTLYLAWASWFVLHRWCLLCIGTYASVIGLCVASGLTTSLPMAELPGQFIRDIGTVADRPVSFGLALLVAGGTLTLIRWFPRNSVAPTAGDRASFEEAWAAQPRMDLGIPFDGATVVVVNFIDWQCGSCRSAYVAHEPILAKYDERHPGMVKSVTKDYPLSNQCNVNITIRGHAAACEAAAAVRLAAERGRKKEMIDWLFANQMTLTPRNVEAEILRRFGITDFSAEYARVLPAIQTDVADASSLRVDETPTYYVNGRLARTPGAAYLHATHLDWAIQYELSQRSAAHPAEAGPRGLVAPVERSSGHLE